MKDLVDVDNNSIHYILYGISPLEKESEGFKYDNQDNLIVCNNYNFGTGEGFTFSYDNNDCEDGYGLGCGIGTGSGSDDGIGIGVDY